MTRFHIRDKVKTVVKVTAKVALVTAVVAKEVASNGVRKTIDNTSEEMKKGWADALTSDKHWLESDSSGGGDSNGS